MVRDSGVRVGMIEMLFASLGYDGFLWNDGIEYCGQGIVFKNISAYFAYYKTHLRWFMKLGSYVSGAIKSIIVNRRTCKSMREPVRNAGWRGGR